MHVVNNSLYRGQDHWIINAIHADIGVRTSGCESEATGKHSWRRYRIRWCGLDALFDPKGDGADVFPPLRHLACRITKRLS